MLKKIFAGLVRKADIVLENFRPGVMSAMGFSYEMAARLMRIDQCASPNGSSRVIGGLS